MTKIIHSVTIIISLWYKFDACYHSLTASLDLNDSLIHDHELLFLTTSPVLNNTLSLWYHYDKFGRCSHSLWRQVLTWMTNFNTTTRYYYLTASLNINKKLFSYHYYLTMINSMLWSFPDGKSWLINVSTIMIMSYYYLTTSLDLNNKLAYYHYDLTVMNSIYVIIPWGQVLTWMTNLYTIISYYYLTTSLDQNNTLLSHHILNWTLLSFSDGKSWLEWSPS